jgi:class 3 adenylate cyclase/TolB-like protein
MAADPAGQSTAVLPSYRRKLIAVVFADMAGYSRLIGLDDAGTFERLRELRRDLIDPALTRHGGTLVSTAGDSLLVTFDSIMPAVRFAVDVQRGVPDFDGDYASDRRVRFRMGINVGDVIPDGTSLYGDGVNVAARLQSVCPPGAICVSRVVRDHVGSRLGLAFKELGTIALKNIAQPTEVFLLELAPPTTTRPRTRRHGRILALTGLALCFLAALAGGLEMAGVSLRPSAPPPRTAEIQAPPPRLSIAVLPFSTLGGNPDLALSAAGVTEDLAMDLAQLSEGSVTPQQRALRFKDQPVNPQKAGQELDVRYVVTGSLRRVAAGIHANVALISSETGAAVWVDQLDVATPDSATDQEQIAGWLRNSVIRQLTRVEAARSARERPDHPDALDLRLQARAAAQEQPSASRTTKAQVLYEQALHLDPTSVEAMIGVANTMLLRYVRFGEDLTATDLDRVRQLTAAAQAIAPAQPAVLWLRAELLRVQQRWQEATAAFGHMLSVYPHYDPAIQMLGICKLQLGQADDAIALFQQVIRNDPRSPGIWVPYIRIAQALLLTGRYDEAVHWFQRSLAADPELPPKILGTTHALLASAYALAGRTQRARKEIAEANALWPYETARGFRVGAITNETFAPQVQRLRDGLRLAGLRDHADENEDFGTAPDSRLRTDLVGQTPLAAPDATTIRTPELAALLHDGNPIVIDTTSGNRTLVGAISLPEAGLGGTLQDPLQDRLRSVMATLTGGDLSRPTVALGYNAERWTGYNLTLRLVALGYRRVSWYRGGREAWDAAGLPMDQAQVVALDQH